MTQSRVKNSAKNTFFAALNMLVQLILKFAVRIVFVRFLSVEYLGLNTLFSNILQVLSLAELGVGSAIVYSMYKPVADGDTEKIKSLIGIYKKFYWIIGGVITVVGLAIIPLLPYLMSGGTTLEVNLNLVYVIYLFNTSVGYFFAHRRALIFANQRNDIETKVSSVCLIALNAVQLVILAITKNYLFYISVLPLFTIIDSVAITVISHRLYPDIRGKAQKLSECDKKDLVKNTAAMVGHRLGGVAVNSTDNIFISAFLGLTALGLYSNYAYIVMILTSVLLLIVTATKASIGNLIAAGNKQRAYEVFCDLSYFLFAFLIFCFSCYTALAQDFVSIFFGEELVLPFVTMLLIGINFYIMQSRAIIGAFRETTGLFWKDRYKPFFEVAINIGLDFALVIAIGLPGIVIATIVSNIVCNLTVEPYIVFKYYFGKSVKKYYLVYVLLAIAAAAVCAATFAVGYLIPADGVLMLIVKAVVCAAVSGVLILVCSLPFKQFRNWLNILKGFLRKSEKSAASSNSDTEKDGESASYDKTESAVIAQTETNTSGLSAARKEVLSDISSADDRAKTDRKLSAKDNKPDIKKPSDNNRKDK